MAFAHLLAALCASSVLASPGTAAPRGAELARRLADPAAREKAFCELVREPRYHSPPKYLEEKGCKVSHVVVAPQLDGPPMYVVFRSDPDVFPQVRLGSAAGPFTLVDGDGFLVPVHSGNGVLDAGDRIIRYAGDERLAFAYFDEHGHDDWRIQVLEIVPVTPDQRPVLRVIVGPPVFGDAHSRPAFSWAFTVRTTAAGAPALQIGPKGPDGQLVSVAAEFTWAPALGGYTGSSGGAAQGFLRLDADPKASVQAERDFAEALRSAPPNAVPLVATAPTRDETFTPCVPGTAEHEEAKRALSALSTTIERLGDSPSQLDAANRELSRVLASRCFALSAESPRAVAASTSLGLRTWWRDGGDRWLRSYLELAHAKGEGGYTVLPPDMRPALSPGHVLACRSRDARCGRETRGWRIRAQEAFERHRKDEAHRFDERPASPRGQQPRTFDACGEQAGTGPGSYGRWRRCLEDAREVADALPLGELRAPRRGWFVVAGRRGHYHFCDELRAYDLATGAAFVAQSCSGLVLQRGGTVDHDATSAVRQVKSLAGRVPVDNLREAAWMAVLETAVAPAQIEARFVRVPAGMTIEWLPGAGADRSSSGSGWFSSAQTSLGWWWIDRGRILARGDLTWPSSSSAADTHAVSLLDVAEQALVEEPPRLVLPRWVLEGIAAPGVSAADAAEGETDAEHRELRAALGRFTGERARR